MEQESGKRHKSWKPHSVKTEHAYGGRIEEQQELLCIKDFQLLSIGFQGAPIIKVWGCQASLRWEVSKIVEIVNLQGSEDMKGKISCSGKPDFIIRIHNKSDFVGLLCIGASAP
jgi:hypothetical protein